MSLPNTLRSSTSLATEGYCIWGLYDRTDGLEKFRQEERYAVWLHTHSRLMHSDRDYRQRVFWFRVRFWSSWLVALCLGLLLVNAWLAFAFGMSCALLSYYQEHYHRNRMVAARLRGSSTYNAFARSSSPVIASPVSRNVER
jgi:hypothetical protein